MNIKLLIEHHLEFLSLKGGYTGLSESTLFKMPHSWKSHVIAHICIIVTSIYSVQVGMYVQSDQSLRFPPEETLDNRLPIQRPSKTDQSVWMCRLI